MFLAHNRRPYIHSPSRLAHYAVYLAAGAFAMTAAVRPVAAQTTFGPGAGGALVDGTAAGPGVFTSTIVVNAPNENVLAFNSVTLTNLTHTFLGDLLITLTKLDTGQEVVLASPPDGNSANLNGTYTFVVNPTRPTLDEASAGLDTSSSVAPGSYAISDYGGGTAPGPRTTFTPFNGIALTGTWQLSISDFNAGDTGTLGSWQFNATSSAPEPGTMSLIGTIGALSLLGYVARRRKSASHHS